MNGTFSPELHAERLLRGMPEPWSLKKKTIVSSARPARSSFFSFAASLFVHHRDAVVVLGPIAPHLRRIRMIGGKPHFGRIVNLVRCRRSHCEFATRA